MSVVPAELSSYNDTDDSMSARRVCCGPRDAIDVMVRPDQGGHALVLVEPSLEDAVEFLQTVATYVLAKNRFHGGLGEDHGGGVAERIGRLNGMYASDILSRLSGKSIHHVNVTPDEVERGLVAAGIPQFAARSVRELDEETSRRYQAIITPTVANLTGRVPMSVEDFLQTTVPALIA